MNSNFISRTLTGSGLVAIMLISILFGVYSFMIFFLALLIVSLYEFYKIFENSNKKPQVISGIVLGVLIFIINFFLASGYTKPHLMFSLIIIILYIVIAELFRKHTAPFENIAITVFGIVYIAIPIAMLWDLGFRSNIYQFNVHLILGFFLILWTYDSMAYIVGMAIGKHRLFERISPKKSWEGAIGGYIFSVLVAYIISKFYFDLTFVQWGIYATLITVFGTFGDLAESMLKRSQDIKDSSSILPGHGGILDRFDSLFLAVPAVYLYLQFI